MTARFKWERVQLRSLSMGEPDPESVLLRCSPVWWLVLEVVAEPARLSGTWTARWRYQQAKYRGRAESIEEAQECALDAAEGLLVDALEQLENRRTASSAVAEGT